MDTRRPPSGIILSLLLLSSIANFTVVAIATAQTALKINRRIGVGTALNATTHVLSCSSLTAKAEMHAIKAIMPPAPPLKTAQTTNNLQSTTKILLSSVL